VKLTIRNHDGPRRWFLVPARLDLPLVDKPRVHGWQQVRWTEHVRADYLRFWGHLEWFAIPVAGYGSVSIEHWPLPGRAGKLEVWELNSISIDGEDQSFQTKLPYDLAVARPDLIGTLRQGQLAAGKKTFDVSFAVKAKHAVAVK
jgi:hypothetical protein